MMQEQQYELQSLLQLASSVAGTAEGASSFRTRAYQRSIPQSLCGYVLEGFMEPAQTAHGEEAAALLSTASQQNQAVDGGSHHVQLCSKGSEQWKQAIARPGLPLALQLLAALAKGHQVYDRHSRTMWVVKTFHAACTGKQNK